MQSSRNAFQMAYKKWLCAIVCRRHNRNALLYTRLTRVKNYSRFNIKRNVVICRPLLGMLISIKVWLIIHINWTGCKIIVNLWANYWSWNDCKNMRNLNNVLNVHPFRQQIYFQFFTAYFLALRTPNFVSNLW